MWGTCSVAISPPTMLAILLLPPLQSLTYPPIQSERNSHPPTTERQLTTTAAFVGQVLIYGSGFSVDKETLN